MGRLDAAFHTRPAPAPPSNGFLRPAVHASAARSTQQQHRQQLGAVRVHIRDETVSIFEALDGCLMSLLASQHRPLALAACMCGPLRATLEMTCLCRTLVSTSSLLIKPLEIIGGAARGTEAVDRTLVPEIAVRKVAVEKVADQAHPQ